MTYCPTDFIAILFALEVNLYTYLYEVHIYIKSFNLRLSFFLVNEKKVCTCFNVCILFLTIFFNK